MTGYRDFAAPEGVRVRGTVLVLPGRGESQAGYGRFGARLAADAYQVRVLPPSADLSVVDTALKEAVSSIDLVRPLVLAGADVGAAVIAALVARSSAEETWWPDAVVLAGLPGYGGRQGGGWDEELDVRTHCPVHRG
ncbi:hypothetical protein AB0C29_40290, partial [Actinoplanes sp. NPDC048791]|uniref:hypothetical protein n=1 Tax=Actinoplanes sp. NPDC048791 TaxID=3154623 RepID=UPI0033C7B150